MPHLPRRVFIGGLGATALATCVGLYEMQARQSGDQPGLQDDTHIPLTIAWADSVYESMLTLCQNGLFERFGLDVKMAPCASYTEAINTLNRQASADVTIAPLLDWIPAFYSPDSSRPPVKLACSIRTGYYRVVARRDRRIHKLSDLQGKTVGITSFHGADRRFLSIRLRRKFLPPTENIVWTLLPASEMASAFLAGKIDAFVLHDTECWRVLKAVGASGWNMLDSMTGMAKNRVDLVAGISENALAKYPLLPRRLSQCFSAAQKEYPSQVNALIHAWEAQPGAPPDIAGMLRRQTGGTVLTNSPLRIQIAQYIDEFKLINLIPSAENASQIAGELSMKI